MNDNTEEVEIEEKKQETQESEENAITRLTKEFTQKLAEKDEEIKKLINDHKNEVVSILKGLGKPQEPELSEEEQMAKELIEKINKSRRR